MKQYCFLKIKSRISSKLILPNYSTKKGVFFLALFSNIKISCNNTIISDKKKSLFAMYQTRIRWLIRDNR